MLYNLSNICLCNQKLSTDLSIKILNIDNRENMRKSYYFIQDQKEMQVI